MTSWIFSSGGIQIDGWSSQDERSANFLCLVNCQSQILWHHFRPKSESIFIAAGSTLHNPRNRTHDIPHKALSRRFMDDIVHGMFIDSGTDANVHGFCCCDKVDYSDVIVCYLGAESVAQRATEEDTVCSTHGGCDCCDAGF